MLLTEKENKHHNSEGYIGHAGISRSHYKTCMYISPGRHARKQCTFQRKKLHVFTNLKTRCVKCFENFNLWSVILITSPFV
jgi:hypothetical protein